MGGTDEPKAPEAPKTVAPPNVTSGLGSAKYSNGSYNFSLKNEDQYKGAFDSAMGGYQNQLDRIKNPQALADQQMGVYRNAMVPAFDRQAEQGMGAATAGLGHQYNSTFGQLTMNDVVNQNAIARAGLEKNIYDAGQSGIDREIGRAGQYGSLASGSQAMWMAPYGTLNNLTGTAGNNVANYNNAANDAFKNNMAMYQYQMANQPQGTDWAKIGGTVAGGVAGAFVGNPMLGAQLGGAVGGAF